MPKRDIKALTSIRMIAAALVFFYHFFSVPSGIVGNVFLEGHLGVTIFFVLSGFLISMRYYDDFAQNGITRASMTDYYRRRVARIYPLYAFLLVASLIFPINPFGVMYYTLTQGFFASLFVPTSTAPLIVTWTLTAEECFYLLLPLIAVLPWFQARRFGKVGGVILKLLVIQCAFLAIGSLVVVLSNAMGMAQGLGFMAYPSHMILHTIFGRFWDFGIGIVMATIYKRHKWVGTRGHITAEATTLLGILIIVVGANGMHEQGGFTTQGGIFNYLVAVGAGLLIWGLTHPRVVLARLLSWSPFVYLGRVSYALYLVQGTWLFWYVNQQNFVIPTSNALAFLALFYGAATLVSIVLYEAVEKPMQRFILRRTQPAPAKAPVMSEPAR